MIAIIAILAGMLLPALSRARESARKTHCINNQKSIATMFLQYADDSAGMTPPSGFNDSSRLWQAALAYVAGGRSRGGVLDNRAVFILDYTHCASRETNYFVEPIFACPAWVDENPSSATPWPLRNYGINRYFSSDDFARKLTRMKNPSLRAMCTDHNGLRASGRHAKTDVQAAYRHSARQVYSFADGHVEPLAYEAIPDCGVNTDASRNFWGDINKAD